MKKLMIAVAAIAVGVAAHAATVDWQIEVTGGTDKNQMDNYTAYLVSAVAWDAYGKIDIDAFKSIADGGTVFDSTTFDAGSGKSSKTFVTTEAGVAGYRAADVGDYITKDGQGNYGTGDFYAIIMDANGNYYKPDGGLMAMTLTGRDSDAPGFTTGGATTTFAKIQTAGNWVSTSAIPEPTSGIMLLLGVGLMALKRKRA